MTIATLPPSAHIATLHRTIGMCKRTLSPADYRNALEAIDALEHYASRTKAPELPAPPPPITCSAPTGYVAAGGYAMPIYED